MVQYRDMKQSLEEMRKWPRDLNDFTEENHDILDRARTAMRLYIERGDKSPAFLMIEQVWNYSLETTGHSWERLNHSMMYAVELAIFSGMKFDLDDFGKIAGKFRMQYWGSCGSFYVTAVKADSVSACRALEKAMGLKPWIVKFGFSLSSYGHMGRSEINRNSGRLAAGARFYWDGHYVRITSMDTDHIIACSYKNEKRELTGGGSYYDEKLEKRYRLIRDDLIPPKKKKEGSHEVETVATQSSQV